MSPNSAPGQPCVVNENLNPHWQLLLEFGLEDYGVAYANKSIWTKNVRGVDDGRNYLQIASQDKFQTKKFKIFTTIKSHEIKTV